MGMAASQARFLGLTARQNNIEFEGQQINQQRTMLANQSANYYTDLLGMSVPVPPSVDSYSKTVYTFNDGALTNTITSLIAQPGGTYMISYLSKWQEDYVPVAAGSAVVTDLTHGALGPGPHTNYFVGATELRYLGQPDWNLPAGSDEQINRQTEEQLWIAELNAKYGNDTWLVRYVTDTTLGVEKPYFYRLSEVSMADYDPDTNISLSNINVYTIGSEEKVIEHTAVDNCIFERDSSGRLINLTMPVAPGSSETTTYALTTETTTDQDAYNDAMNNYEYEKYLYDQAIENINSKIAIIQAQDKNLELRLKQLDTERNAVMTEKDAVSKVIENNVKDSFKTFSA